MSIPAPPPPTAWLATLLRWLGQAVAARNAGSLLATPAVVLILGRIRDINQRFARLAARLAAGPYAPPRHRRRKPASPRPRRQNPLPQKFGWLLPLVPEAVVYRSQLEYLLRDPAMAALMASAPAPMARVLRPLCWMLRVTPPPILARPRPRPDAAPPPPPAAAPPASPPDTRPAPPAQPAPPASPVARACGPPLPA